MTTPTHLDTLLRLYLRLRKFYAAQRVSEMIASLEQKGAGK